VTAVILAAGVARRLAPLTDRTQKSLLPVGGRAILAWMLEALHAAGVGQAVIVVS
jgi:N-acetyl-alpha-D-muramate 1-phosphate uridylyltransferase